MTTIGGLNTIQNSQSVQARNARAVGSVASQAVGDQVAIRFGNAEAAVAAKGNIITRLFKGIFNQTVGRILNLAKGILKNIPGIGNFFKSAEEKAAAAALN